MIDINDFMGKFLQMLNETFGDRVWFVGLQGSFGRGEACDTSDIDVVVILDELSAMDIQTYHNMLSAMPHRELICGFLSGKTEILNWEPSDLFQFCNDTTPIKGSLDEVAALIDDLAV
ncbi:MAG: nucleotidyltransferase domain-containing protein, partial [Clostridia bacterium]|nr:nucleotidyltransferase domain-containing protein [Clostridia bacterium]